MARKAKISEETLENTAENINIEELVEEPKAVAVSEVAVTEKEEKSKPETKMSLTEEAEAFKFFKNCSASLKKLSFITFVINLFLIIIVTVIAVVYVGAYIGMEMVSLLAVPLISAVAILVIFARLVSALIYGFGVIVEKHEK
ncbi:MAG: hypothetical protein IKC01_01100 [Clostridia bacterium]|nr:hypothetical protein [Clostridia bacterium]